MAPLTFYLLTSSMANPEYAGPTTLGAILASGGGQAGGSAGFARSTVDSVEPVGQTFSSSGEACGLIDLR